MYTHIHTQTHKHTHKNRHTHTHTHTHTYRFSSHVNLDPSSGNKIYLPFDPPPLIDGVRINSPHYLCKILITEPGNHYYTLVISQYEKSDTIHYTIRTYRCVTNGVAGCVRHRYEYTYLGFFLSKCTSKLMALTKVVSRFLCQY